jgi:hypothetical protein
MSFELAYSSQIVYARRLALDTYDTSTACQDKDFKKKDYKFGQTFSG